MKKIALLLVCLFYTLVLYPQNNNNHYSFKFITGFKYTPIDYIGGGILGFIITKEKFSLTIRNDFSFSVARKDSARYFGVDNYRVYNYAGVGYRFHEKFSASLGCGWISNKDEITRLNPEYGYYAISADIHYFISDKFKLELKCDIPFVAYKSAFDQNTAFPVALGLIYDIQ